jgi:hypothetical protein
MELSERIDLEGCNFFRLRVLYSLLSGSPISIGNIRPLDDDPGVKGLFGSSPVYASNEPFFSMKLFFSTFIRGDP